MRPSPFEQLGLNRVAYIKYGDVAWEYSQILNRTTRDGDLGYLGRFIALAGPVSTLLLSFCYPAKRFRHNGNKIIVFAAPDAKGILYSLKCSIQKVLLTLFALLQYRPDVIVCGRVDPALMGAVAAAKLLRIPILLCCHHAMPFEYGVLHRIRNLGYRQMIKLCDRVSCVGPFLNDELISLGVCPQKLIQFLPSFHDILLPPDRCDARNKQDEDYILFAGRIEENKGVFDLLDAYERLPGTGPPILVYAGEGSARKKLEIAVSQRELSHRVRVLGQIPYTHLGALIRNSRFVVVPSKATMDEGICKIAVESLVLGIPVVVPDYGVFPYLVTHGKNGLIYATDSIGELAVSIQNLVENQELRNRLASEARKSGQKFLTPRYTFSQAILCSIKNMRP